MNNIPVRHITDSARAIPAHFKIRAVETLLNGSDLVHALHRHDFFFVLALQNGEGSHEIDFNSYDVTNNTIFILRPGQVHELTLTAGSSGFLMEFSPSFYFPDHQAALGKLRKASSKNYCSLSDSAGKRLQSILANIFREFSEQQEGYVEIIKASLDIFFLEFLRQHAATHDGSPAVSPYTQRRFEEFSTLLESHISSHKQVGQYAALMNVSAFQLNHIAKQSVGKKASELINEQLILEAKRQLLATIKQVKEVADQLGYEDVSYFIRFFKRHTGYSPDAYRQNYL